MATSPRSAAVVVLCAACAAAVCIGGAALEAPRRAPTAPAGSALPARSALALTHLHMPALPLPVSATHTIVAGDTLWSIAASSGIGVDALAAANGLSEDSILALGRVLTIPRPGTAASRVVRRTAASVRPPVPARSGAVAPAARPRVQTAPVETAPAPAVTASRHLALLWPSRGIVTSRFGWRVHPIFGGREFHTGMDIATRYGSPVVAARAGIVRFVGWKSGYGRIVVLAHGGGIETAYSHLSAALVSPGQQVGQGQVIGRIGNSGWSTGPHLFFEVRRNGVPMDPAHYLN